MFWLGRLSLLRAVHRTNRCIFMYTSDISVSSGDGGNPSPSGEEKIVDVPEGDETPPTEVGGLRMKRGA